MRTERKPFECAAALEAARCSALLNVTGAKRLAAWALDRLAGVNRTIKPGEPITYERVVASLDVPR